MFAMSCGDESEGQTVGQTKTVPAKVRLDGLAPCAGTLHTGGASNRNGGHTSLE